MTETPTNEDNGAEVHFIIQDSDGEQKLPVPAEALEGATTPEEIQAAAFTYFAIQCMHGVVLTHGEERRNVLQNAETLKFSFEIPGIDQEAQNFTAADAIDLVCKKFPNDALVINYLAAKAEIDQNTDSTPRAEPTGP